MINSDLFNIKEICDSFVPKKRLPDETNTSEMADSIILPPKTPFLGTIINPVVVVFIK